MKRFLTILFLTLVLSLVALQLLHKDKINIVEVIKKPFRKEQAELESVNERARFVKDSASPPYVHNDRTPKWMQDPTKQRQLILQHKIGGRQEDGEFQFRNVTDIEFDAKGNLFVLDYGNKSIEVFDSQGKHVRTLGIGPGRERVLSLPTDLALDSKGRVYVCDRRKGILIFKPEGKIFKSLKVPYQVEQIAINSKGQFIVLTPSRKYLLHKLNSNGREILAFAHQKEASEAFRQVFSQGKLSIDAQDDVYLSYIYPYRIMKYNAKGQAALTFDRELERPITPPTIERGKDGEIKHVFRQEISYDLQIGSDGLIYNLIRTKGAKGGNNIDIFSPEGAFLQSFYLTFNAISFALQEDQLALLSPFKFQKIARYRIMPVN